MHAGVSVEQKVWRSTLEMGLALGTTTNE